MKGRSPILDIGIMSQNFQHSGSIVYAEKNKNPGETDTHLSLKMDLHLKQPSCCPCMICGDLEQPYLKKNIGCSTSGSMEDFS